MHPQTTLVTLGCLLHDVGKLAHRAGEGGTHSEAGCAFLKQAFPVPEPVLDCVRWHHAAALRQAAPGPDNIAYIACAADNISAAADRREEGAETRFDRTLPLAPIFSHLNHNRGQWRLEASAQDGRLRLPLAGSGQLDSARYRALLGQLEQQLQALEPGEEWLDSLLAVLETFTGSVPSSTWRGESPDISLFDHLKTTAAMGACISEYLRAKGQEDLRGVLFQNETAFRDTQAFLLYSADFSGVQKFIYTIAASDALRTLRSRSFFLDFAMEHYVDELLGACGVSRANLLYSGGGHCYLLLPNTDGVRAAADAWNTRFNEWLFAQFGTRLFLAHGYTPCTANQLTNTPAQAAPYKEMFRRVSAAVARHKLHRVTAAQLRRLNSQPVGEDGRECAICGRSDTLVQGRQRCRWCALFEDISRKIQTCGVYFVSSQADTPHDFVLPGAASDAFVCFTDEETARRRLNAGEQVRRIYTKNIVYTGLRCSTCLYVGDYASCNSMEELAQGSGGIRRLAVCRMDVDDLGHAFVAGFEQESDDPARRYHYVTISRTAAFSRQMSLFFKRYINSILSGEYGGKAPLQLAIVYSGGDDVFLVGAWDDVIEGAVRIRQAMAKFTCGALHISAGIGIFDDHFPIRSAALQTADLEDEAKNLKGKDAVALFGEGAAHTYHWDDFVVKVRNEKLAALQTFFEGDTGRGNSLLYRMLELLRDAQQNNRLALARYAYLLARLEPPRKDPRHAGYRAFADKMYGWALDKTSRRQLITAILIHVYQNRKRS